MKQIRIQLMALLIGIMTTQSTTSNIFVDFYEQHLKTWHHEQQETIYPADSTKTCIVSHARGSITVIGHTGSTIRVVADKKSCRPELLKTITIKKTETADSTMQITVLNNEPQKSSADLCLLVPDNLTLGIALEDGSITVQGMRGTINALTEHGSINVTQCSGTILATAQRGSITVKQAQNNVKACTQRGSIVIDDATHSVLAETGNGSITVRCKQVPSASTIDLKSGSGNILLALPTTTNANIFAHSSKAQVTCEHFITTKPQTIQLNPAAWQRFKRELDGILGTGEATIKISSHQSSINITKTTT